MNSRGVESSEYLFLVLCGVLIGIAVFMIYYTMARAVQDPMCIISNTCAPAEEPRTGDLFAIIGIACACIVVYIVIMFTIVRIVGMRRFKRLSGHEDEEKRILEAHFKTKLGSKEREKAEEIRENTNFEELRK
jgi:ABC-type Fe3+ transport system permease subunit